MPNNLPSIEYRTADALLSPVIIKTLEGIISGYPIVFNERTCIGNCFYEEIDLHALDDADISDIKLLSNHNDSMLPLARHRRGKRSTMEVTVDNKGMFINADVDIKNNVNSQMLCSAVDRGDIEDMSFCFGIEIEGDSWSNLDAPLPIRRITKIRKVYEVSAVNDGAYPQTSINARSVVPLDNAKRALANARSTALDNEKKRSAKLNLEKEKIKIMEDFYNDN